jgi:hypothetical protein
MLEDTLDTMLSETGKSALRNGSVKIRVRRSGMMQLMTFTVRRVTVGNITYTELYSNRQIDMSELLRVAGEVGLPVEAENAKAFPDGTSMADFQNPE